MKFPVTLYQDMIVVTPFCAFVTCTILAPRSAVIWGEEMQNPLQSTLIGTANALWFTHYIQLFHKYEYHR